MEQHIKAAQEIRTRVEREMRLNDNESWIREPEHKHDMFGPGATSGNEADDLGIGPSSQSEALSPERKEFLSWVRSGRQTKASLVEDATGQNVVPRDFAGIIIKQLPRTAVIRSLAFVRPTSSNLVDIGNVTINTAGWGPLETNNTLVDGLGGTPAAKDTITVQDLNALVLLGRDELEDADSNLEGVIVQALTMKIAELEDDAFAFGTGTLQPWGVAARVTSGLITQGVVAATNATVVGDELKKVPFAVPAQFRKSGRAAWLGNTVVEQAIALLKDTNGRYLLRYDTAQGEPPTLFGYPWYTQDGLPLPTATGTAVDPSLVFGDFYSGYMIADRRRMTVQRLTERYAEVGKVGLLFTHRVGGDVIRPNAFAFYKL